MHVTLAILNMHFHLLKPSLENNVDVPILLKLYLCIYGYNDGLPEAIPWKYFFV